MFDNLNWVHLSAQVGILFTVLAFVWRIWVWMDAKREEKELAKETQFNDLGMLIKTHISATEVYRKLQIENIKELSHKTDILLEDSAAHKSRLDAIERKR